MKTYYHWTSWHLSKIKEGMITGTYWEESNYWIHKKTMTGPDIELDIPDSISGLLPREFLKNFSKIKYEAEFKKEELFESVRKDEYLYLPSRKRCIYAIPSSIDPYEFGRSINLNVDKYSLIEIRPVLNHSKIFQSKMSLLNCNSSSILDMQEIARTYWNGESKDSLDTEVLIEGEIEVVRIVNFGQIKI